MAETATPRVIVQTERLVLRRDMPGDFEAWMTHLNTPEVTAHLGGPRSAEQVAEKFERMGRSWEEQGFSFMMIALRDCGTFLGTCGIGLIDTDSAPETLRGAIQIGWTLRADYWGRGLALEAARGAMDFAFGGIGTEVLYGQTSVGNQASWRLMEKLGMSRRTDLDYADPAYPPQDNPTIIYAIDRPAWAAQAGARAA